MANILCFSGKPGSGKTYEAVKKVLDNLKLGRQVFTNIDGMDHPDCIEAIKGFTGLGDYEVSKNLIFLKPEEVYTFFEEIPYTDAETGMQLTKRQAPPGSVVVLDEVHKNFNTRDWNEKSADGKSSKNRRFSDWLSTSRHEGTDVVLITQNLEKVDKQVRDLVHWNYVYRKVDFLGAAFTSKYLVYAYNDNDTHGKPLTTYRRSYDPRIFPCYQSYVTKDTKELGIMTHANVLKHPIFYALVPVTCFAFYMLFFKSSFATGDIFGVKQAQASAVKKPATPVPAVVPMVPTPPPATPSLPALPAPAPVFSASAVPSLPPVHSLPPAPASAPKPEKALPIPKPEQLKPLPEWMPYPVSGFVQTENKLMVAINGRTLLLPSDHVSDFDPVEMTARGKTKFFGALKISPPISSTPPTSTVSNPVTTAPTEKETTPKSEPQPKIETS